MNYYGLSGKMTATDGNQTELLNILLKAAELLNQNQSCLHYVVSRMNDDKSVWVNEVWTTKAAHDASLEPANIRELVKTAMPLLDGPLEPGVEYTTVGGKGLTD